MLNLRDTRFNIRTYVFVTGHSLLNTLQGPKENEPLAFAVGLGDMSQLCIFSRKVEDHTYALRHNCRFKQ
jgi:hypothetical protein